MIPRFVEEWRNGFHLVYGDRKKRTEFYGVHLLRLLFYCLNRLLADNDIILDMAEFALFTRRIRDAMLDNRSTFPFLRAEAGFAGFELKRHPRPAAATRPRNYALQLPWHDQVCRGRNAQFVHVPLFG